MPNAQASYRGWTSGDRLPSCETYSTGNAVTEYVFSSPTTTTIFLFSSTRQRETGDTRAISSFGANGLGISDYFSGDADTSVANRAHGPGQRLNVG